MADLYENLLKATSNIDDITTEKYGVITKLDGLYCSVKETDNELEHNNVPIINGANLSVGDKVIIGFLNNSIYDVVCYGALDKTVHDDTKQDKLISGSNIKTVNNESLLGSGNITIQGGSNVDIVTSWETTPSDTKVASEKLTKDTLDTKQATLVSGNNIKTVNSTTLLGSGDISIPKGDDGSLFWTTTTAPTTPNYTFTISNLVGETGKTPKKGDIIFYSYYRYTVDTVGDTTLKATSRQSIRGSTGATGATGNGISSISKTGTSGLVDTYTITYTNTDTDTFTVTNGSDATVTVVDNLNSDSSTSVLSAKQGKVLNTNKIETSAIATSFGSTTSDSKVPSEKLVSDSLATKQATLVSGTNIKTINSTSLLGSGDIQITGGSGGSCVTDFYIDSNTDEWVIETSACSQGEVVTSWSSTLTDTKVPSEKLVKEYVDDLVGDAILFINGSGT